MAKRGGKNRNKTRPRNASGFNFEQSVDLNNSIYRYYYDIILKMAMMRFRWINLPNTCDARYLEYILATQGVATIAFPKKQRGTFYSTMAVTDGKINVYDNPSKWRSYGNNGWNFYVDNTNGVLVRDNSTRFPLHEGIRLYANELTHIRMTKRINRLHQQIPFVFKGPQEKRQDMITLFRTVANGAPAVIGENGMDTITWEAIDTRVAFLGEELAEDEINVWNRIYIMLGFGNSLYKAERQTEDEIRTQKSPSTLVAEASLECRREAAERLNRRFAQYLEEPIKVVLRQDNESENWNLLHNMESQIRMVKG